MLHKNKINVLEDMTYLMYTHRSITLIINESNRVAKKQKNNIVSSFFLHFARKIGYYIDGFEPQSNLTECRRHSQLTRSIFTAQ